MLAFFMNNLSTILVGGGLLVVLVLIVSILRKNKGSCSSCSSCAGCSASGVCHPEKHK